MSNDKQAWQHKLARHNIKQYSHLFYWQDNISGKVWLHRENMSFNKLTPTNLHQLAYKSYSDNILYQGHIWTPQSFVRIRLSESCCRVTYPAQLLSST